MELEERITRLEHDNANLTAEVKQLRATISPELQVKATEKVIHLGMILDKLLFQIAGPINTTRGALLKLTDQPQEPDGF